MSKLLIYTMILDFIVFFVCGFYMLILGLYIEKKFILLLKKNIHVIKESNQKKLFFTPDESDDIITKFIFINSVATVMVKKNKAKFEKYFPKTMLRKYKTFNRLMMLTGVSGCVIVFFGILHGH